MSGRLRGDAAAVSRHAPATQNETDVTKLLSRTYSVNAQSYKELWAPIIHRFSRSILAELPLSGARQVVDIGAGVGTLLPDLSNAAPDALVVGVDRSEGMIAEGPVDIPRAVMDARQLGFAEHSIDAVIMAFVLFHLDEPILGLLEAARVLRPRGAIGVLTWGQGTGYHALDIWNEELDALGAAPADERFSHHELVNTPDKLRAMLQGAGFVSVRAWTEPFEHRQSVDEFLAHRTGHGASKRRFDSLPADEQRTCIQRVGSRLRALDREDLTDHDEVVFAVAIRPSEGL